MNISCGVTFVGQPVMELVHTGAEVAGLGAAGVQVAVILGQEVNIVKH